MTCQDRTQLKAKYGKEVALAGQVDCPGTLFMKSPADAMEECINNIEDLSSGGGYILASGCEFPPNAPLVNARAMVEAAKTYGTYG
jgi:uroporphyrinogen decarboxylase